MNEELLDKLFDKLANQLFDEIAEIIADSDIDTIEQCALYEKIKKCIFSKS